MKAMILVLALLLLSSLASAKATVSGSADGVVASGVWEESHEGVSLFCTHLTNAVEVTRGHSESTCFLTEVQAIAKDSPFVSTNLLVIQTWDKHGLTAITTFYADNNGNETTASAQNAVKYTFRLVVDFDTHSVTKYGRDAHKDHWLPLEVMLAGAEKSPAVVLLGNRLSIAGGPPFAQNAKDGPPSCKELAERYSRLYRHYPRYHRVQY